MKKTSHLVVILYGLCAVIWIIRVIADIAYQTYHDAETLFVLNILCAIVWTVGFFINLNRYRSGRDEQ